MTIDPSVIQLVDTLVYPVIVLGQLHIEMRKEKIAAKTEGSDVHSSNEQS